MLVLTCAGGPKYAGESPRQKVYRSPQLGIEFGLPSNWVQERCEKVTEAKDCVLFYAPRRDGKPDPDNYALMVEVKKMDLEKAIEDDGLFEKVSGKWMTTGGYVPTRAKQISGDGWRGIYAFTPCGLIEDGNYHAAAGSCLTAILSDGSRSVSMGTGGAISPAMVLRRVVMSLRFIK
jgi:hypothetical protein